MLPILLTPRCRLRDLAEGDLPAFARYRANPAVARFQSWSAYSLVDAKRLYAAQRAMPFGTPGTWHQIAIASRADDALLGDCALHFLEDRRQVEIGFTLAPEFQGKGLGREAVTVLLEYIFGTLGKERVIAVTDAENHAARNLLMALGFREDAAQRHKVIFKGKPGEECLYLLPASGWKTQS